MTIFFGCVLQLREGILSTLKILVNQPSKTIQELIVNPLSNLPDDLVIAPRLAIIDTMDGCEKSLREPLCFCDVCRKVHQLPIWFKPLVTRRPEPDITACLAGVLSRLKVDMLSKESVLDILAYTRWPHSPQKKHRLHWPRRIKNESTYSISYVFIWTTLSFALDSQVQKLLNSSSLHALYRTVLVQGHADAVQRSFQVFVPFSVSRITRANRSETN
jgi:hypothetical protein